MKRKILLILLVFTVALSSLVGVEAAIYDMKETRYTTGGVEITTIKRLTTSGWLTINVSKADISDGTLTVELLKDKDSITKLRTTKALADQSGAVAAINGDFFGWSSESGKGSSVGVEISDGELLSGYALSSTQMAVGAETYKDGFFFDYIDTYMTITAPNGVGEKIKTINKYDPLDGIVLYDKNWGDMSIGSGGNLEEMVVEDGIVTAINHDVGSVAIPENGYVLAYLKDINSFIPDNFKVGDSAVIDSVRVPDIQDDIRMAAGGGTLLVTQGMKAKITHTAGVREPRSAWGVDKDEKHVYFVTVDGRSSDSIGVTLSEFTDILLELGLYNAINLDGGGSTTLVAKEIGNTSTSLVNTPSDSGMRQVINGIGIVSNAKMSKCDKLLLDTEFDKVFVNSSSSISVTPVDKHYNKTDVDMSKVEWTVTNDNGYVIDGMYYPQKAGEVTIKAKADDAEGEITLNVLSMPVSVTLSKKEVSLKSGEKYYVSLVGHDEKGYSAPINLTQVGLNSTEDILGFEGNSIVAKSKGTTVLTFTFGDVSASMTVRVGGDTTKVTVPKDKVIKDSKNVSKNVKSTKNSFSFALFGNTFYRKTLLEKIVMKNLIHKIKASCDMIYFAGMNMNVDTELIDVYTSNNYSHRTYKGVDFFTINNVGGSVFKSGKNQWATFILDLKRITSDNVFIIMPAKLNFTDDNEKAMFEDIVNKNILDKGKDVYVFSNGIMSSYKSEGMHCFTVDGVGNLDRGCVVDDAMYLKVNVENGEVTYSFEKIFE